MSIKNKKFKKITLYKRKHCLLAPRVLHYYRQFIYSIKKSIYNSAPIPRLMFTEAQYFSFKKLQLTHMKSRPQKKKKTLTTDLKFKSTPPKHSATPEHILIVSKIKQPREILRRLTNFTFYKIHKHIG